MLSKLSRNENIKNENKSALVKEFMFYSTWLVKNRNLLKSGVSEICVKQLHVDQGVGVLS